MKKFLLQVGASLLTAALIANVTLLWNFNARLTAIETKLVHLTGTGRNVASNP